MATHKETAKRVMIFYFCNQFGQASAMLLAYGILHMRGVTARPGWFWLFALMDAFTIASGFVLGFFLLDSFQHPHGTFAPKWQIFSERQIHILRIRVQPDDPSKGEKRKTIGLAAFRKAFGNWRLWIQFLVSLHMSRKFPANDTSDHLLQ